MFKGMLKAVVAYYALSAGIAFAQGGTKLAPLTAGTEPGDIIVTARRRAESLQDVPISVSAVTGETLAVRGIKSAVDLQYQTPSLTVTSGGPSQTALAYSIRGQRTNELQLLTDPPVGLYFAEVVVPRTYGFGASFYDLQNVQVLKGVQGTLFGRNMTGGAVLLEPNHPDLTGFHAEGVGQYGNYDMKDLYGMVNVPIVEDVFGVRVAGKYRSRDGYMRELTTGRDLEDQNRYAFRVSAELHLDRLTSFTVFDFANAHEHGSALKLIGYSLVDPLNGSPTIIARQIGAAAFFPFAAGAPTENLIDIFNRTLGLGKHQVDYGEFGTGVLSGIKGKTFSRTKNYGVTNKTTFEAGDVTFKNIFGYRKVEWQNQNDYDGSPAALVQPFQLSSTNDYSEEFQMQGTPLGSRLQLTLGGYYFREAGKDGSLPSTFTQLTAIGYASSIPALASYFLAQPGTAYLQTNVSHGAATSYAFYAAGTYTLTEQLKLSGGIRYNDDERVARVNPFLGNLTIPGLGTGFCTFNGLGTFTLDKCEQKRILKNNAITYDATIQYEPDDDLTTYLSMRRGYRAGGFSLRAQSDATFVPFQPEFVKEYEFGLKNKFETSGGSRLNTSLAIYYQDYTNVQKQVTTFDPATSQINSVVQNTATQRNYGGEFEANMNFGNGLSANLFYAYVKNKITKGQNIIYAQQGVPKHQLGGGLTYQGRLGSAGGLVANLNATYRSSTPLDENDAIAVQKGYALVNARVGIDRIGGSAFGLAAFASNLTNKYYYTGVQSLISGGAVFNGINPGGGVGYGGAYVGEPRTYGIEASFRF